MENDVIDLSDFYIEKSDIYLSLNSQTNTLNMSIKKETGGFKTKLTKFGTFVTIEPIEMLLNSVPTEHDLYYEFREYPQNFRFYKYDFEIKEVVYLFTIFIPQTFILVKNPSQLFTMKNQVLILMFLILGGWIYFNGDSIQK